MARKINGSYGVADAIDEMLQGTREREPGVQGAKPATPGRAMPAKAAEAEAPAAKAPRKKARESPARREPEAGVYKMYVELPEEYGLALSMRKKTSKAPEDKYIADIVAAALDRYMAKEVDAARSILGME